MVWADWTATHPCPDGEACAECGGTRDVVYATEDGVGTIVVHDLRTPRPEDATDG